MFRAPPPPLARALLVVFLPALGPAPAGSTACNQEWASLPLPHDLTADTEHSSTKFFHIAEGHTRWADAAAYCASLDAHLACIGSRQENDFVTEHFGEYHMWIGMNDVDDENAWHWPATSATATSGCSCTGAYTNWDRGQPGRNSGEDCGGLQPPRFGHGQWHDYSCTGDYGAVENLGAWPMAPTAALCECLETTQTACEDAEPRRDQAGENGEAVQDWLRAEDEEEDVCPAGFVRSEFALGAAWIGLHQMDADDEEAQFVWSDGSAAGGFTAWAGGEPNDWGAGEDCVEIYPGGEWNDGSCESQKPFICQNGPSCGTSPTVAGHGYVGCFHDEADRDLAVFGGSLDAAVADRAFQCAQLCAGYTFLSMQWTDECFCDNDYGKHGQTTDDVCDSDGAVGEFPDYADLCGTGAAAVTGWTNAVYRISYSEDGSGGMTRHSPVKVQIGECNYTAIEMAASWHEAEAYCGALFDQGGLASIHNLIVSSAVTLMADHSTECYREGMGGVLADEPVAYATCELHCAAAGGSMPCIGDTAELTDALCLHGVQEQDSLHVWVQNSCGDAAGGSCHLATDNRPALYHTDAAVCFCVWPAEQGTCEWADDMPVIAPPGGTPCQCDATHDVSDDTRYAGLSCPEDEQGDWDWRVELLGADDDDEEHEDEDELACPFGYTLCRAPRIPERRRLDEDDEDEDDGDHDDAFCDSDRDCNGDDECRNERHAAAGRCVLFPFSEADLDDAERRLQFFDAPKTWAEAEADCRTRDAHLVTVCSDRAAAELAEVVQVDSAHSFWIGLTDQRTEGVWQWADGGMCPYRDWHTGGGEPNGGTGENCANVWGAEHLSGRDTMSWNDITCEAELPYVCATGPRDSASGRAGAGGRFIVFETPLNLADAMELCEGQGRAIASIKSERDNNAVVRLLNGRAGWIGLHDSDDEDVFIWRDGSALDWSNWSEGEPNNWGDGEEDCVMVYGHGNWNDQGCASEQLPVCGPPVADIGGGGGGGGGGSSGGREPAGGGGRGPRGGGAARGGGVAPGGGGGRPGGPTAPGERAPPPSGTTGGRDGREGAGRGAAAGTMPPPPPPPAESATVLAATATFALDEVPTGRRRRNFENEFKAAVAGGLPGVAATDVTVTGVRLGSVVVDFEVHVASADVLTTTIAGFSDLSDTLQVAGVPAHVSNPTVVSVAPPPSPTFSDLAPSRSTSVMSISGAGAGSEGEGGGGVGGLIIGIVVGALLVAGLAAIFFCHMHRQFQRKLAAASVDWGQSGEHAAGGLSVPADGDGDNTTFTGFTTGQAVSFESSTFRQAGHPVDDANNPWGGGAGGARQQPEVMVQPVELGSDSKEQQAPPAYGDETKQQMRP